MKNIYDLAYLCACALTSLAPDIDNIDIVTIVKMAQDHEISGIILSALSYVKDQVPDEIYTKLSEDVNQSIFRLGLLDEERENICSFLEENQIWYMPLKGVILKDIYPEYGMRDMCDNDILYDETKQEVIMEYFTSRGYTEEHFREAPDNDFLKPPVYNFEMHRQLFSTREDSRWVNYYKDIKNRLIKDEENNYGYHFTDEDFYVYMMLHAKKHLDYAGVGLRSLLDCYVFIQNKKLDWDYIEQQEKILDFLEIERLFRNISLKIFESNAKTNKENIISLTKEEEDFLRYLSLSGAFGTTANLMENDMNERSAISYVLWRVFPPLDWYEVYAPFVYKHQFLIPFYWIWRTCSNLLFDSRKIAKELKRLIQRMRSKEKK